MGAKEKRIYADEHVMLGHTGAPSDVLAPGDHVVFDEDAASHNDIEREIKAGRLGHLRIEEVDLDSERESQAATEEALEQLSADDKARQDNLDDHKAAAMSGKGDTSGTTAPDTSEGQFNPEEHNVADVLDYLQSAPPEEVDRVKSLEASSSRDSTQVANFESKEG